MQTEVIKAHEEAQQALKKELRNHEKLKLQLEQNKTLNDGLQRKFETLQLERATLQSDISDIRERPLHLFFVAFWNQTFYFCCDLN